MSNHAHPRRTFVRLKFAATMLSLFALLLVAPVGELRWRPPAPIVPWSGVRTADRFSPICMQRSAYPADVPPEPMSEDCITLNIWVPPRCQGEQVARMGWIYGGGLLNGTASTQPYAGNVLARRDVTAVTFNYRLGALGFLAYPVLTSESQHRASGNYGLLDPLAALQCVLRNIAPFGGDPGNVTVFGQSSGSFSISTLATSLLAHCLFRRAISHCGGLFEPVEAAPDFGLAGAEKVGQAFAKRMGAASLNGLRAKAAAEIVVLRFAPNAVADGHVLRETPHRPYTAGRVHAGESNRAIDRLSGVVRFALEYGTLALAAFVLVGLLLAWRIARFVLRRRAARTSNVPAGLNAAQGLKKTLDRRSNNPANSPRHRGVTLASTFWRGRCRRFRPKHPQVLEFGNLISSPPTSIHQRQAGFGNVTVEANRVADQD